MIGRRGSRGSYRASVELLELRAGLEARLQRPSDQNAEMLCRRVCCPLRDLEELGHGYPRLFF